MTREELWNWPLSAPPVLLPDGNIGQLTVVPSMHGKDDLCGVQVPGEPDHRWYHRDNLSVLLRSPALLSSRSLTQAVLMMALQSAVDDGAALVAAGEPMAKDGGKA